MPKTRRLLTRVSKGELSPLLQGSPDLEGYFEGATTLENFHILRQGGITRWPGSRHVAFAKYADKDVILLPFEPSVTDAYVLEIGDFYIRVYKNKAQVLSAGVPVEIVTPFAVADIRSIHTTQSADVLFMFHGGYQQRILSRVSDTQWTINAQRATPPPSYEADTTLSGTIAISANTGNNLQFRTSSGVLLDADNGRQIIIGSGRAVITAYTSTNEGICDILDDFSQTITAGANPISTIGTAATAVAHGLSAGQYVRLTSGAQAGELRRCTVVGTPNTFTLDAAFSVDQVGVAWNAIGATATWQLRLSPQTTLDPSVAFPVGTQVRMVAGVPAFRAQDVGKFIIIYGGVVKITKFTSSTEVAGTILSIMGAAGTSAPPASAAGTWTLETESWSASTGWPRTGEFHQGRLYQASTASEPTTFWGSRSDDYDNYAIGVYADDAVNYPMAARSLNKIEWLREHSKSLLIGTGGTEHIASGSGENTPLGGDTIPSVSRIATNGCMGAQPISARNTTIYIDRSRRKFMGIGFDLQADKDSDTELSVAAEHITESGIRLGPLAHEKRLNPRIYACREDGQLVAMAFFPEQKVVAFSRRTTSGTFESCAVIPGDYGESDHVWVVAKRTINGQTTRCIEVFDENHSGLQARPWHSLQTDGAVVVTGITGTSVTGLTQFSGRTVDVIKNGSFVGQYAVTLGGSYSLTLLEALVPADVLEIGFHYDSTFTTMRPAIPGNETIEGLPRSWDSLFTRVHQTIGGKINGEPLPYPAAYLDTQTLYSGDIKATGNGWGIDGRVTITQDQPYPMTILATFGTLSLGDKD